MTRGYLLLSSADKSGTLSVYINRLACMKIDVGLLDRRIDDGILGGEPSVASTFFPFLSTCKFTVSVLSFCFFHIGQYVLPFLLRYFHSVCNIPIPHLCTRLFTRLCTVVSNHEKDNRIAHVDVSSRNRVPFCCSILLNHACRCTHVSTRGKYVRAL